MKFKNILVLHGPNLNLLGERETSVYGKKTLTQLNLEIKKKANLKKFKVKIFQSNSEGKIIDLLHAHRKWADAVVINPGAYTHYSYAIRDAIAGIQVPTIEVHLSDIKKREPFRRVSVIKDVCMKQISGFGFNSYLKALDLLK